MPYTLNVIYYMILHIRAADFGKLPIPGRKSDIEEAQQRKLASRLRQECTNRGLFLPWKASCLLLMIEILHDLLQYQNHGNYGSMLYIRSCRVYVINSIIMGGFVSKVGYFGE